MFPAALHDVQPKLQLSGIAAAAELNSSHICRGPNFVSQIHVRGGSWRRDFSRTRSWDSISLDPSSGRRAL